MWEKQKKTVSWKPQHLQLFFYPRLFFSGGKCPSSLAKRGFDGGLLFRKGNAPANHSRNPKQNLGKVEIAETLDAKVTTEVTTVTKISLLKWIQINKSGLTCSNKHGEFPLPINYGVSWKMGKWVYLQYDRFLSFRGAIFHWNHGRLRVVFRWVAAGTKAISEIWPCTKAPSTNCATMDPKRIHTCSISSPIKPAESLRIDVRNATNCTGIVLSFKSRESQKEWSVQMKHTIFQNLHFQMLHFDAWTRSNNLIKMHRFKK